MKKIQIILHMNDMTTPTLDETVSQTINTSETAEASIDEDWMVAQSPDKEIPLERLDVSEHTDVIPSDVEQDDFHRRDLHRNSCPNISSRIYEQSFKGRDEMIQNNADLEVTSGLINDSKEEPQGITKEEEELVERSLFDQYDWVLHNSLKQIQSQVLSALQKYRPMKMIWT